MENRKIGAFIAERRKENGLTQQALADCLGLTNKAVSKWETGVSHSLGYHTTNPRLHDFQNIKFWRYTP